MFDHQNNAFHFIFICRIEKTIFFPQIIFFLVFWTWANLNIIHCYQHDRKAGHKNQNFFFCKQIFTEGEKEKSNYLPHIPCLEDRRKSDFFFVFV